MYLEIGQGSVTEAAHMKAPAEVACLDMTPLTPSTTQGSSVEEGQQLRSSMVAVGTWSQQLLLLSLPQLTLMQEEHLGGQVGVFMTVVWQIKCIKKSLSKR